MTYEQANLIIQALLVIATFILSFIAIFGKSIQIRMLGPQIKPETG